MNQFITLSNTYLITKAYRYTTDLILVPVPVGSALGDLATKFTGTRAVVVDDVIEGDVRTGEQLLLLRDDEGAVNICNRGVVGTLAAAVIS